MDIHPEAERLISDAINKNGTATLVADCAGLLSQAIRERDALKGAADEVYNRLMPEVESLRAQVAAMREALEPLRHMELWTESAEDHEMCLLSYGTVKKLRALITLKGQSNDH